MADMTSFHRAAERGRESKEAHCRKQTKRSNDGRKERKEGLAHRECAGDMVSNKVLA
jgi:hypothetical protein